MNRQYNFSKNLYKALIAPVAVVLLAIVLFFCVGLNKGIDIKGGIIASVNVGTQTNLQDAKTYNQLKGEVKQVLNDNDLSASVYLKEVNELEENVFVVKIAYNGKNANTTILALKQDLQDLAGQYHSTAIPEDLVMVETFGSSLNKSVLLATTLATFIAMVLMAIYIAIRLGLNAGVLAFVSSGFNILVSAGLIALLRIQVDTLTILIAPFTAFLTSLSVFVYRKKTKDMLSLTDKYEKQSNEVLANDAVLSLQNKQLILFAVLALGLFAIDIMNIFGMAISVAWLARALFLSAGAVLYGNLMILPGAFARTYVRKVKKQKQKAKKVETKKITEEELYKETDLDNLVSN